MTAPLLILSGADVQHLVQTALDPREVVRCMARTFELVSGSEIGVGVVSFVVAFILVGNAVCLGVGDV